MNGPRLGGQACGGFGNRFPSVAQQGMLAGNLGCSAGVLLGEHRIAGIQEFLHVVESLVQLFLEAFQDKFSKALGHVGAELSWIWRLVLYMLNGNLDGPVPVKGQSSAGHLEENDAHAVNVGLQRHFFAMALFRRHVFRSSHGHAGLGQSLLFHLLDV